ncbi:MAG TPA: tetratricopeptide repeat protein [Pyrinomonadaceae bacterium]|nr:tetratricopeptide repeat protein [Pyrinomonadaceae bacterium]
MFRKNYLISFLTIALFLIGSAAAFGQTAPVGGQVILKAADGKVTPVEGALVEVLRTDIKAKPVSDTTDKKGHFNFAGLPLGAVFVLSISGPGIGPEIIPNIKAGMDRLTINVLSGDGKRWTEDEVRSALANPTGTNTQSTEMTAEQKKAKEEYDKKVAETKARNEKALKANEIVNASLKEGGAAYDAKNYDLAIAKFDEGYKIDPDFAGSAPVLLNNKGLALLGRATDSYNKSVKADDATRASLKESAKNDLLEAVASSERSLEILKTATTTDPNIQKNYDVNKFLALTNRKTAYRLMAQTGVERNKGKEALLAFQEYIAAEPDAARKSKAQLDLALTLQDSNEFELAITEFQKILETDPNNVDALVGIGLSMVNVGYINLESDPAKGKAQLQEAANYLQKFVDVAPDTHKFKEDAKSAIASLKEEQKVVPQKGKTTTTKKKN